MVPPRRFVETEETFHFFSEDAVLGTNEIRNGDASSSSSDSDSSETSRLRRARRRRRASSVASRRTSRRLSRLLNGSVVSELEGLQDDSDEDDYDSLDDFELEEEDEEIHQPRQRNKSTDKAELEPQNTFPVPAVTGTKVSGVGAVTFEQIFEPFRDLYVLPRSGNCTQKKKSMNQQMQLRKARRAIAAFTRRVHCANAYRYRKQSEFMRVCYQRALETGPGYEVVETSKVSDKRNEGKKQALLVASQKEDAVETTVPNLFPRKWPHLPYRSPLEWINDTDAAIEFLSRLAELPETSLIYEPIDANKFAAEVTEFLELTRNGQNSAAADSVFAGLLGLFAMGVQLQSFTLLSKAALQFIKLGQATYIDDADGGSTRPELQRLLKLYCSRLAQHVAEPILAATFPRDLSAQWKVCSYQPSTSDAIATDGLYLYIFGRSGLLKIGTGNGTTARDFVYAHNKDYVRSRDAERSWLCCIGDELYCRTIVMPGHRVDRIRTNDLQNVQELVLAPNRALIGKGTTESSVYAMVTDGVDLFTIRCIDTYKKSSSKTSSSRKHRSRSHKSRKSTPVSEIVNAVLGKSDSGPNSPLQSPEPVTINVGDRVVRGPDWKWSNQDGEKGSPGTVERISTWGGVKGSGVTVRWDKNQRVNTYRWGAEGCYDLYIVTEKDGFLERKPLPNVKSSRKSRDGEGVVEGNRENEPDPLPRHQLVLYRHKVDSITSIMKLEEPDIDLFLDLTPSREKHKHGTSGSRDAQSGVETLSALHSHTVTLCTSKTSWMCDGGTSNCFGDNAAKRYRCTSGCDFDLCESCLFATVSDKPSIDKSTSEGNAVDDDTPSIANTTSDDTVPGADDGPVASDVETTVESFASEGADPFANVDVSLFAESAREASLKKKDEDKKKLKQQTEDQMVNDLAAFWCGLYTRKECQVALRRNGLQLNEASTWLHTCGAYLREPMVIPTVSSVILAAKPKSGALDPVLLIAGTFFATHGQLCVVSPPGLYTVGEEQSDKVKRAASSNDASWFFSLENGSLLAEKPVLLKGVPAGSPTCVDMTRKRILVFSGYLNCLEEYVDHVQQSRDFVEQITTECTTLADTGMLIISQLAQLMRKRAALPAYKHPRAGLQDVLFRTGREPAPASTDKPADHRDGDLGTKSKNRRIKNIRARLKELDRLHSKDPPGYIIPFCVDFEDEGLLQILRAVNYYCGMLSSKKGDCGENGDPIALRAAFRLVADLLRILAEIVQEFEFVGVTMNISSCDEATQELFQDTERTLKDISRRLFGDQMSEQTPADGALQSERSRIVISAHFLLVWGIRKGIFFSNCRSEFFISACEDIIGSGTSDDIGKDGHKETDLPESFFAILLESHDSLILQTMRDCGVDLLRRLLFSPMDDGRIAVADFVPTAAEDFSRFLEVLFALSKLESRSGIQREKWLIKVDGLPFQTPVSKALHAVMNYCCARMYAANIELTPTSSFKEVGQEVLEATTSFERFARTCFDSALEMLRCYQGDASNGCDLQASVVGTILPMVIAFIPNFPDHFSDEFRDRLLFLMRELDTLICSDESTRVTRPRPALDDAAIFGGYQVVETPHPYNHTQPVFRRVVHIPGASVLHFEFDPRCRTSGEADIVFITSGLAWYQADRLPYGDVGFGEDGGCFFGSYSRGNWPAGGLTVVGDTATVMLCATTQARSGTGDKQRWGLKCTVRGLFGSPQRSWLPELGCSVANACGILGDKLLRGSPPQGVEKSCQPWVMERQLFNLPVPACNILKSRWKFVDDVVNRTERGEMFFSTLSEFVRLRTLPPRHSTVRWEESLQVAAAVLLVRSNHHQLHVWLDTVENQGVLPNDIESALFHRIAVELGKLERWMLRQVQLVSEWHYLCIDEVSLDELMERYADNLDRLSELCQLKSVVFKKSDMTSCVKSIHELLVKEIAAKHEKDDSQSSGSHEAVAQAVLSKTRFLLARWEKCVEYGYTYLESVAEPIHSAVPDCLSDVSRFLCSTVPISALEECSTAHSARLESRLAGIGYCEEAITNLKNDDMAQFFVGRVLYAVPSNTLMQDDAILSGCAVASPLLLAKTMASLNSYAKSIACISESKDALPAFRAVALADIWNCAHSVDSISSRALGLERVSKLILALDGEMWPYANELSADKGVLLSGHPDAREVHRQVYDTAWILLRLLAEEVLDNAAEQGGSDTSWKSPLKTVFGELCALYEHFAAKQDKEATGAPTCVIKSSDEATYRLMCTVANKVAIVHEWPEVFCWWIQNAIDIVATQNSPLTLSVASTRLIRYALELLGDAMFDLSVVVPRSTENKMMLGMEIQDILLKRVGEIVSPLPVSDHASNAVPFPKNNKISDHCVIIFQNEVATDKLVDAANSVGEPDVSSLEIPVEGSDGKDAVEKAITEAVAECTAAQATMKHSSVRCDGCNQSPLRGFRFKCFSCPNYDLCTSCYTNQNHNMDHPFVRLADATGSGDLLQPRSKGGNVVPETALVGSKPWKGNLLRVLLDSHGYVNYCFGTRRECCDTANALANLGFLVTVAHSDDMADVDALHDWEGSMQLFLEPGSSRLSHRRSPVSGEKNSSRRANREVINAFNRKAALVNSTTRRSSQKVEHGRQLASEVIAVLRLMISGRSNMQKWRSSTLRKMTEILEDAPHQITESTGMTSAPYDAYFLTLGATQVLGGFREPLRIGGNVLLSSYAADKARGGHTGVVYSYAFGNDDIVIATLDGFTEGVRNGEAANDDDLCFYKRTTSEVKAISGIPLGMDTVELLEPLVVPFCAVVRTIYEWTSDGKSDDVDEDGTPTAGSLLLWELACALIQSFSSMAPSWPSLFDNQVISTNGNCPAILFQLAQMCVRDLKVEDIADMRELLWNMEWLRSRDLHLSLATRPISSSSFSASDDKTCVLRPPTSMPEDAPAYTSVASDGSQSMPEPSEYFYSLYAFSSRNDLPQHSGRNKMLEYWEKNVIPAIETYVSGSFKSYEMDYFFAQLREPLREGNAAAALKIAFTLCDGHVPSGCHYPDPDTDWSALQIDDLEVGGRYVIASENVDVADWSRDMLWTLGHTGTVRVIDPSGMVLLQVVNPVTSASEYWWYHVDNLRAMSSVVSVSEQSVTDFEASRTRLKMMNQQLIYSIARKSVFDLLQAAPEHAMKISIETRKTSLARTSSSPLPLPTSSSIGHAPMPTTQLTAPLPKNPGNRYDLADLLRLAAAADLGCPEKVLSSEIGMLSDSTPGALTENSSSLYLRPKVSPKSALITVLQTVLNKQFERAASSPPPPVMDRSTSYDENASVTVTMPAKKHKKRGKQGALAGKLAAVGASAAATSASSSSAPSSSGSSTSLKSTQPKLQQPDVTPALSTRKHRYLLMEALLSELKAGLDLSSAFLRSRSFMVTSDSPPQPLVLIHVPDATCLVLSFAVHPVLMDLPAGSSLEFFRDERCTDRLFGYFGDKRGLSYLPPLVVPGDKCYVRMSQGTYARYKFRVDPFTSDFGLALWLCEEIYQKLLAIQLSHYEVETVLTTALNALVEYLIATTACLPANAKTAVYQITAKLINFALSKGAMHAVPIAKLSGLVKELTFVHDNERTTQKGLFSLYTQQLAELISLVEEVSSLKGGSSSILGGAWWKEFVRMAVFTRVLAQGKREIATPDAFKRVYCGRAPIREIQTAQTALATHDLFGERILFLQNLPCTSNVAELRASLSRFIVHLALEECGEADDQNVYSAAAVTRFGIVADILFMPVDSEGQTMGYAMIDIGRADVISNLLTRISKETFEFDGGTPTEEDHELLARIEAVCRPPDSSSGKSNDGNDSCSDGADPSGDVWACSVCTLENSLADAECAACGSPIPPEMANLARDVQAQSQSSRSEQPVNGSESAASSGWACTTCTFVNSWADTTCDACTMERSADLVPPSSAVSGESNQNEIDPVSSDVDTSTSRYRLSAARFVEIIRVADDTSDVPKQVTHFLHHQFFETSSTTEAVVTMAPELRRVLNHEASQYFSTSDSKAAIEAFAALASVTKNHAWDSLSSEERLNKLTSVKALSEIERKTLGVYKCLRSSGYDLQFELSHYGSMDDAMKAQAKWTHQMDCQLIAVCRELSGKMGVLMLTDLCPSHLNASHAREYLQIASLETRDLRLRFAVLQSLNKLLVGALPLVNLRPWSDPSSLRSRIVSIRQLIFPGVKIRFFAHTQDNTTLAHSVFVDTNAKRPMVTIDRRKIAGKRGGICSSTTEASTSLVALRDPRRSLFASTMKQLSAISPSLLRAKRPTGASDPFVSFIVIFAGENVVGEGGPYRQLFNDISNELLASGNPLFIPSQNNVMKAGEFRERYMPKPSSTSKELLQMFEFVGILMGCCLRTGVRLNLRLAPLVWKMLVKQNLVLTDLESVDHSLCESLKFLEELASAPSDDPNEVLYDSFTTTLSDGTIVELKDGGQQLPVTKANAKEYIRLVKATRLQECKPQVDAMLRGLGKIVPVQLLQLCVWSELQQWVSGSLEIDINLLKRHTRYSSGMSPEQFPHLEMFWKVLSSFSEENKRRFINFAWGQDTLPADDAEFDRTHTRLLIKAPSQDCGVDQDAMLPKADTCFFNIELPVYSNEEIMREKLLLAITLCTSLDGDEQTAGHDIYYAGDEIDDDVME